MPKLPKTMNNDKGNNDDDIIIELDRMCKGKCEFCHQYEHIAINRLPDHKLICYKCFAHGINNYQTWDGLKNDDKIAELDQMHTIIICMNCNKVTVCDDAQTIKYNNYMCHKCQK